MWVPQVAMGYSIHIISPKHLDAYQISHYSSFGEPMQEATFQDSYM